MATNEFDEMVDKLAHAFKVGASLIDVGRKKSATEQPPAGASDEPPSYIKVMAEDLYNFYSARSPLTAGNWDEMGVSGKTLWWGLARVADQHGRRRYGS